MRYCVLILFFFFLGHSTSLFAQTYTKQELEALIGKLVATKAAISKLPGDTATAVQAGRKNQTEYNPAMLALSKARAEYLKVSSKTDDPAQAGLEAELNKLTKTNALLDSNYRILIRQRQALLNGNVVVNPNEFPDSLKVLAQLKEENTRLTAQLIAESDSAKHYDEQVKNAARTAEENKSMENSVISFYNENAQKIAGSTTDRSSDLPSLNKQRQDLIRLGIDSLKLFSLNDFLEFTTGLKLCNEALAARYDKTNIAHLIQLVGSLKNRTTFNKAQKDILEERYKALAEYCGVVNTCSAEIIAQSGNTGLPVLEDDALKGINKLLAIKGIERYPFLITELNRLKGKYKEKSGFKDPQITPCTN